MLDLPSHLPDLSNKLSFTVMSYNVLAQNMINRECYPYTSQNALKWANRKVAQTKEIAQINPDIICLQECAN